MNFEHTEERRMLADSLNRFIAEQYSFATRDRIAASPEGMSAPFWEKFAELGVPGALIREEDGGFGGGDAVVVDDQQVGEALLVGITVAAEREGVARLQPAMVGAAAVVSFANVDHDVFPFVRLNSCKVFSVLLRSLLR